MNKFELILCMVWDRDSILILCVWVLSFPETIHWKNIYPLAETFVEKNYKMTRIDN